MGIFAQLFRGNIARVFLTDAVQSEKDISNDETDTSPMKTKLAAAPVPKKVVKKAGITSRKNSSAPKVAKASLERALVCAEGHECFWLQDGSVLTNLMDLRDAFKEMSDEAFAHHVTGGRNDFSDWVQFVLRDQQCAEALRTASDRSDARSVTVTHLKSYRV